MKRKCHASLRFETLEGRDVLTAFHWTGADASPNWNVANNWINETTNTVNGFPNAVDDVAKFLDLSGDVIIIPDGARLTAGRLSFDDPDDAYAITRLGTGSLTLDVTSGDTTITVSSGNQVLGLSVELADPITFDIAAGGVLNTVGAFTVGFSGPVTAKKIGSGTLHFGGSGSNDFQTLFVQNGLVELAKTSGEVISDGSINIGDNAGPAGSAVIRALSSDDIGDSARVIVAADGLLDLNGFNDTVGSLSLLTGVVNAGVVSTGTGTLRVGSPIEAKAVSTEPRPVIYGKLELLSGQHVVDVESELTLDINAAISGSGGINKADGGTLRLLGDSTLAGPINVNEGSLIVDSVLSSAPVAVGAGRLAGSGTVHGISVTSPSAVISPGDGGPAILSSSNGVTLGNGATLELDVDGLGAGTGHDQLEVIGAVNLANATLSLSGGNVIIPSGGLVIISNNGSDAVNGQFAALPEGGTVTADGQPFKITYNGGDGNDVALLPVPLAVNIAPGGKVATFVDVDGDLVTVKTTTGVFDATQFTGVATGAGSAGQLQQLKLQTGFTGANISITAKRTSQGGNGFVNVGFIDATGVDLGAVTVRGDLGRIKAGTVGGDPKVPAIKSLTVQSLGLLGTTTQLPGGSLSAQFEGALPRLTVHGDLRGNLTVFGVTDGKLGTATIGGSFTNSSAIASIFASAGIGSLRIAGDVRSAGGGLVSIDTTGAIGSLNVGGSIIGASAGARIQINAVGQLVPPTSGLDLAIKSFTVRGNVEHTAITAGHFQVAASKDASIGAVAVGGDWIASSIRSGTSAGTDFLIGTNDDESLPFGRDDPALFATIGSITIKGQAVGSTVDGSDMFGIVAERIGKAKVGGRTFAFTPGGTEGFFAAPTGPGGTGLSSDFTIREIGSVTTNISVTPDLSISADGKTATFNDVDGDLVTVKRSKSAFVDTNFDFTALAPGQGLSRLIIAATGPEGDGVDIRISAKPGPLGGNGFVNVGQIFAVNDLSAVSVAGDLAQLFAGNPDDTTAGVKSVSVHSIGQLSGGASGPVAGFFAINGPMPKLSVATDVRNAALIVHSDTAPAIGQVTIGGSLIGESINSAQIFAPRGIGVLRIGGDLRSGTGAGSGRIECGQGKIGTLSIGGDIVGTAAVPVVISARGQFPAPAKGSDVVIGSIVVKGNVEYASFVGGDVTNADASIGTVSVGREWLASSLVAGASPGDDGVFGTDDDAKLSGPTVTDNASISSRIGRVTIKGQAFGSPTPGDHFGIVAESIGLVSIGGVVSPTTKGKDEFDIGATGDLTVLEI